MITLKSWRNVKCITCISFSSCRPAPISQPFGCDQWVSRGMDGKLYRAPDYPRIEGMSNEEFDALTPSEKETAEGIDELCRLP